MKLSSDFICEPLEVQEATNLNNLMLSNKERFALFLPKTLSQNLTIDASKAYILQKNEEHKNQSQFTFAIKVNNSKNIAGLIILKNIDRILHQAEFAYCIGEKYGEKGLVSKAVQQVMTFAIDQLSIKTFIIIAHKTNIGSSKVAEKNGFTWKKTLLNEFTPKGRSSMDMELYIKKIV